jgi:hypothetical protein
LTRERRQVMTKETQTALSGMSQPGRTLMAKVRSLHGGRGIK